MRAPDTIQFEFNELEPGLHPFNRVPGVIAADDQPDDSGDESYGNEPAHKDASHNVNFTFTGDGNGGFECTPESKHSKPLADN